MNKLQHYREEAIKVRQAMDEIYFADLRANRVISDEWYHLMAELGRIQRNYRAYCRRHGLEYTNYDI